MARVEAPKRYGLPKAKPPVQMPRMVGKWRVKPPKMDLAPILPPQDGEEYPDVIVQPVPEALPPEHFGVLQFVAKPRPRKLLPLCRYHGRRYRVGNCPMCMHQDCFRTWMWQAARRSGYLRNGMLFLTEKHMVEDFMQSLVIRFMESEARGEMPMMRPLWLMIEMARFIVKEKRNFSRNLSYEEAYREVMPRAAQRDGDDATVTEAVEAHLTFVRNRWTNSVFNAALYHEIHEYMVANDQRVQLMVFRGDITKYDSWLFYSQTKEFLGASMLSQAFGLEFVSHWVRLWANLITEDVHGEAIR